MLTTKRISNLGEFRKLDSMDNHTIWLTDADAIAEDSTFEDLAQWTENGGHLMLGLRDPMSDSLYDFVLSLGGEAYTDIEESRFSHPWEELYYLEAEDIDSYRDEIEEQITSACAGRHACSRSSRDRRGIR